MYLSFEQVATDGTVKTVADLTVHANATHAEIQADTQAVRYTMDGATDPAAGSGMIFLTSESPKTFLIEDVKSIRFTQGTGGAGKLNIHYLAGRNV